MGQSISRAVKCSKDGINFQSKLEMFTYETLKEGGFDPKYEPESFLIYEGFKFNGRTYKPITYKPDFIFTDKKNRRIIIECKGWATKDYALRKKLFLHKLATEHDGTRYIILKNKKEVIDFTNKLNDKNEARIRNKRQCKSISGSTGNKSNSTKRTYVRSRRSKKGQ